MFKLQRTTLSMPSLLKSSDYSSLIHNSLHLNPTLLSSVTHWVALEARYEGELVGLSLSEIYPLHHNAQLSSFVVKSNYRRQGIGRKLFAFTEEALSQEENVQIIELMYEQTDPYTPFLEKIMASLGWSAAKILLIRCHFNVLTFNASWLHHPYHPFPMSFFDWKDLTPEDRAYIAYLGHQGRFLPYLSPLREEELIDRETSVGLRRSGLVVGWSITRRPDPSTIRYSSLYIDSSLLQAGHGIQLLVESIRRQKQLLIPHALFEVNLTEIDPSWWRFVKKRLMPTADKIERIKKACRILKR
jgi:GNAT superfamily N-acetyltransferase